MDVTLSTIESGFLEVQASSGLNHLGGDDFDSSLTDYFSQEFKKCFSFHLRNEMNDSQMNQTSMYKPNTIHVFKSESVDSDHVSSGEYLQR